MKKYEYNFIEVKKTSGRKAAPGDTFEICKKIIADEAEKGWRLKQIVEPINEKTGVYAPNCYQIIFEREMD